MTYRGTWYHAERSHNLLLATEQAYKVSRLEVTHLVLLVVASGHEFTDVEW